MARLVEPTSTGGGETRAQFPCPCAPGNENAANVPIATPRFSFPSKDPPPPNINPHPIHLPKRMSPNTQKAKVDEAQLEELIMNTFEKVADIEEQLETLDVERLADEAKLDLSYGTRVVVVLVRVLILPTAR